VYVSPILLMELKTSFKRLVISMVLKPFWLLERNKM
jgi:hypothetical protein